MPLPDEPRPDHPRLSRRKLIEIGGASALGLGLSALGRRAGAGDVVQAAPTPRARSVLFVFLFGGPSQLDTFDPKPDAPVEYRSEFGTIETAVAGTRVSELLPLMAAAAGRYALVRTMHCNPSFGDHRLAVHGLLGGIDELPAGATLAASRRDWPCFGATAEYLLPPEADLPRSVVLPGEVIDPATGLYPGQTAGFLGAKFDPFRIDRDPNDPKYVVDGSLSMREGMSVDRLADKRTLLAELERQQDYLARALDAAPYRAQEQAAFGVLTSGRLARAMDIAAEPAELRDRYGRHLFGQSLLLARRLVEAGVPLVQANVSYQALWDTHYNNAKSLRDLIPPFDRAVSALLEDMSASGLLNETLVVVMGEFGRTPKLVLPTATSPPYFTTPGRDHWMECFWGIFAGAGVRGGQTIGRSDRVAAYPVTRGFTHADIGATVYAALGIDPTQQIHDIQGRPLVLNRGRVIEELYTGAGV